jgi:hypothetical protein
LPQADPLPFLPLLPLHPPPTLPHRSSSSIPPTLPLPVQSAGPHAATQRPTPGSATPPTQRTTRRTAATRTA